jgi:hypothetical protein
MTAHPRFTPEIHAREQELGPMDGSVKEALLLEEFREAMNQRRHLENVRSSYLGFYFTFLAASGAIIAALLDHSSGTYWTALGIPLLILFLNALTTLLYISVRRVSALLGYYDNTTEVVRRKVYGEFNDNDRAEPPYVSFEFYDKVLRSRFFSMTSAVEVMMQLIAVGLLITNLIVIAGWQQKGTYHSIEGPVLIGLSGALLAIQLLIRYHAIPTRKRSFPGESRASFETAGSLGEPSSGGPKPRRD